MGSCFGKKVHDPNLPRCAGNNYPRNPAYMNQPQRNLAGPVNVTVSGDGGRDHMGEVLVAGAILHGGGGFGVPGPTLYNPVSGSYGGDFF